MKTLFRSTLILALMALPLAAQPGPDNSHQAERIGRRLQLTEAQKASILAIRDKHRSDLVQRGDAVQHARIDLRSALQDSSTPEPRLRALYDKASTARFDMILARRSLRMEVQAILTPEQRAKAAEMRDHARREFAGPWRRG
jgi:Spy/CpxP family protein refolding chaperone